MSIVILLTIKDNAFIFLRKTRSERNLEIHKCKTLKLKRTHIQCTFVHISKIDIKET